MKQFMKTIRVATVLLCCSFSVQVEAQDLKEFFNNSSAPLVYMGIDFSKVKLINEPEANTFDIKNRYFHSINQLIVEEMSSHYNLSSAFQKSYVSTDLSAVESKNDKVNANDIASSNYGDFNRMSEDDIATEMKRLSNVKGTGIGLVFFMEAMKKEGKKGFAAVWVTLIDLRTKKVLLTERMEDDATGIGFRNYWASVIKKIIMTINKKKYKEWKSRYGS